MTQEHDLMTLIRSAQAGDKRAEGQVLVAVRHRLKAYFVPRAGSIESSDLAQAVLLKVAQRLKAFDGEAEAQFWAWLGKIAKHQLVDKIRFDNRVKRSGTEVALPESSSGGVKLSGSEESPSEVAQLCEQQAISRAMLTTMSENEQKVVHLVYFEDRPWSEVAEVLGKSEAASKAFFRRTIRKLRRGPLGDLQA